MDTMYTKRWNNLIWILILASLILLSCIDLSEAGRRKGRRGRKRPKPEDHQLLKNLKTSEKIKVVTEEKYLKRDWCKTKPLKQYVRLSNGCKGVFINKFCYGQCNSFFIPRDYIDDPKEPSYFRSCSFCKPAKTDEVVVTLRCPMNSRTKGRRIRRKVTRILNCSCIAVPDQSDPPTPIAPTTGVIGEETTAALPRR